MIHTVITLNTLNKFIRDNQLDDQDVNIIVETAPYDGVNLPHTDYNMISDVMDMRIVTSKENPRQKSLLLFTNCPNKR